MGCRRRVASIGSTATLRVNVAVHVISHGEVETYYYHNLKTNAYLNLLRDAATGAVSDVKVKYMAWGTDTTSPSSSDTKLGGEAGRKQVTRTVNNSTGVCTVTTVINSIEANGVAIGEFGLYAGAGASSSKDSGVLVARVVWTPPHTKNELESIQVDWQLQYT